MLEHVGQRLRKERVRQKITIEEAAQALKIKPVFLVAIEKGEFHKLPSVSYAQGFVHNYSNYLGIPKAEITALFKREFDEKNVFKVLPDALVKKEEFPIRRLKVHQSFFLAGGIIVVFLLYLLFQYRAAFLPPYLHVDEPKENSITKAELVVRGKADSNATVLVNDQSVPVNNKGEFSRHLMLFPGKSTITIKAVNRFGKESLIKRTIEVK